MRKFILIVIMIFTNNFIFSQQVELLIKDARGSRYDKILLVNSDVTELCFLKTRIDRIEGLEKLQYLNTIVFDKVTGFGDLSFLGNVPNLKRLFFKFGLKKNDFDFIFNMPNLEVLHIENYYQSVSNFNLKNNQKLEYLGIKYGSLEEFPKLENIPESLIYLNVIGNKIISLPSDFDKYKNLKIFLRINPYDKELYIPDNIILESDTNPGIIPDKYKFPVIIPSIVMDEIYHQEPSKEINNHY